MDRRPELKSLILFVPGVPVAAVRMTQRSKHTDPAAQRYLAYKGEIGLRAKALWQDDPSLARFAVKIIVRGPERGPADLDNLAKSLLDGCNKIVWKDDRQVDELFVAYEYSSEPHVYMVAIERDDVTFTHAHEPGEA